MPPVPADVALKDAALSETEEAKDAAAKEAEELKAKGAEYETKIAGAQEASQRFEFAHGCCTPAHTPTLDALLFFFLFFAFVQIWSAP